VHISIWQQFSSNHSADFIVVGAFTTSEEAAKKGEELRQIIKKMAEWYDNPENREQIETIYASFQEDEANRLHALPEIELNEKYDVGFSRVPLDWLENSTEVVKAVKVFDSLVVLDQLKLGYPNRTWAGQEPFDRILGKMGATVYVAEWMNGFGFWIRVTFTVPTIEAAAELVRDCELSKKELHDPDKNTFRYLPWLLRDVWSIHQDGTQITLVIEDIEGFPDDFVELLEFLKGRGCHDIRYELLNGHPGVFEDVA